MTKKYKVLYIEDDETLAYLTKDNLELGHFEVSHYPSADSLPADFDSTSYDICVLDIMMPGKDGFELAEEIRRTNNDIPIIFLSAKTLKEDRVKGLKLGADDYLIKPFSIEELTLKMDVFLQRSKKSFTDHHLYKVGIYTFDSRNYEIIDGKKKTVLTLREADLLKLLLQNQNRVLKREEILKTLWGSDDYFLGRSLDVFISRLRKILAGDPNIIIENLRSVGFKYIDKTAN